MAAVRTIVYTSSALVDVLATSSVVAQNEARWTIATIRATSVAALVGAVMARAGAFVDVLAGFFVFLQ